MDRFVDSDIRNLYANFDGAAETYREIHGEEQCVEAARRWRLLGKIVAAMEHPRAQLSPPLSQQAEPPAHPRHGLVVPWALGSALQGGPVSQPLSRAGAHTAGTAKSSSSCTQAPDPTSQFSAAAESPGASPRTLATPSVAPLSFASQSETVAASHGDSSIEPTAPQAPERPLKSLFQRIAASPGELSPQR